MQNHIDELLNASERDIDLLIAQHLVGDDFGNREDDEEEHVFIARRWFSSIQNRVRDAVCGRTAVMQAMENPGDNNYLLVAAIADAIMQANLHVEVPAAVLAMKVVQVGVHKLCRGHTAS